MWSVQKLLQIITSFTGGVDLADQYICYYSVGRKNMKWWRKIVWRLHDHAIVNATVIYRANMSTSLSKPLTNLEYRLSLVHALTQPLLASRLGPGRTPSSKESRLTGKHFPYHSEVRRRCVVCAYKKQPHGKAHSKERRLRPGVPSVSSIYAWGSILSYTTPDFITETTRL